MTTLLQLMEQMNIEVEPDTEMTRITYEGKKARIPCTTLIVSLRSATEDQWPELFLWLLLIKVKDIEWYIRTYSDDDSDYDAIREWNYAYCFGESFWDEQKEVVQKMRQIFGDKIELLRQADLSFEY